MMADQPGLPAMNRGRGINRTVIAVRHWGSEIDSEGSLYSAETNWTGREFQRTTTHNCEYFIPQYTIMLHYIVMCINLCTTSETNKLRQGFAYKLESFF